MVFNLVYRLLINFKTIIKRCYFGILLLLNLEYKSSNMYVFDLASVEFWQCRLRCVVEFG